MDSLTPPPTTTRRDLTIRPTPPAPPTSTTTRVTITSFSPAPADRLTTRFVEVGAQLQAIMPGRIVASRAKLLEQLSPEFAFHAYGTAIHFIASMHGVDVGRCSAMINSRAVTEAGDPIGYIGHWECIDDEAASAALLDTAVSWLRTHGISHVVGPVDYSTWYSYRFTIESTDAAPVLFEPHTPAHYDAQWRAFGFEVDETYFTDLIADPRAYVTRTEQRLQSALDMGVRFRCLDPSRFDEALRTVYDLSVDQFSNPHFTKVDFAEFRAMYADARGSIDPRLFIFAIAPDGQVGGFVFGIPNFARAALALDGRSTLPRKLRALAAKRHADSVLIKTFAVDKRMRGHGIGSLLANRVIQAALDLGYTRVHNMTMHESNLSKKMSEGGGGVPIRRYATYRLGGA